VAVDEDFRLTEGAQVTLALGDGGVRLPARVLAFFGPTVLLTPRNPLTDRALGYLEGGQPAYLLVQEGDAPHALSGVLSPAGSRLALKLTDAFRLGQRRAWSRADIELTARLVPQGGGPPPTETVTADVSPTGARVVRPAGMLAWPRYEITLSGGPLPAPIVTEAVPTRVHPDHLSLRFTDLEAAGRMVLTSVVADHLGRLE
jgi:hypothetical protein